MEVLAYKSRSVNERGKEANLGKPFCKASVIARIRSMSSLTSLSTTALYAAELAAAACGEMEGRLLLGAGKMSQQWGTLSGGERQRAIIACGLILGRGGAQDENPAAPGKLSPSRPGVRSEEPGRDGESKEEVVSRTSGAGCVLLLDEPTAACDDVACAAVERVLVQSGVACVIVTHDSRQAERLAHTRILLS
jgi:ABC-type sugar transport system ATPase subunit